MAWALIGANEALTRLTRGARGLDVRSEGEYAQGALPSFANVPVLNNQHRHLVGLTYKQRGPSAAVRLGGELVEPLRADLVERWRHALADRPAADRMLICWRGGLRSQSTADALAADGFDGVRVEGGYKAMRNRLLKTLAEPPPLVTLTGLTGAGKTEVLSAIPTAIDLEGLANHRGSAFGRVIDGRQPAQQTFENAVGFALYARPTETLVEDESMLIGQLLVPPALRARIVQGPTVVLEADVTERALRSFQDYVAGPVEVFGLARVRDHVMGALRAVERRLGGLRAREITGLLERAFADPVPRFDRFEEPISRLLREYYDPMYEYGVTKFARPVLFRGRAPEVREFLMARFHS